MLNLFGYAGKNNANNKDNPAGCFAQFWNQDYHPIELNPASKLRERLDYLHENPVRSRLVWDLCCERFLRSLDFRLIYGS